VTIAAGFKCVDGLVICSDTLETMDYGKRRQSKIVIKPRHNPPPGLPADIRRASDPTPPPPPPKPGPDCVALFAGAGDAAFVDKLIDCLWSKMNRADSYDNKIDALENAAIEFYQKYWPIYPADIRPDAHLLVGLWTPEKRELLRIAGPIVNKVDTYESIGFGRDMSKYLIDKLYLPTMSIRDTAIVANYVLDNVKEHVQYCGGDTTLASLNDKGQTQIVWDAEIEWGKKRFRKLDKAIGPLLVAIGDIELTEEEFKKRIKDFTAEVDSLKSEVVNLRAALDAWIDME